MTFCFLAPRLAVNSALRLPDWRARTSCVLRRLILVATISATAFGAEAIDARLLTSERREMQREGRVIVELLQNLHYSARQFHEIEAKEIVDQFVRRNDPERLVLSAEDVAFLHRRFGRSLKTVYLLKGDAQPAFEIFDLFRARTRARLEWIEARLSGEIDLTADEVYRARKPESDPLTVAEIDRAWELRLKRSIVDEMADGRSYEDAVREVRRGYQRWGKAVDETSAWDARESFFESLIGLFDPHSGYSGPARAEEFQISMKGAVAGGGFGVWVEGDVCRVSSVLDGGAAEAEGTLRPGDEILGIAEEGGEWVETAGKREQTIVTKLRGAAGTKLRVAYRRGAGERQEVALTRTEVVLPEQRARGAVFEVPDAESGGRKIGWIELPDFYASGIDSVDASATRDVKELLAQMRDRGVEGVVLDLRRNPGGAMTEAVALTGIFIGSGPVFLTRGMDGETEVHRVADAEPVFAGPLVVAVSRQSASASEIVAGALQYHRRAVVVGSAATFGKGTAQAYIDLNANPQRAGAKTKWGMLRVTGQRFYLPDGRSPQRRGTEADIVFPHAVDDEMEVEAELPHALAGDETAAVDEARASGEFARVDDDLLKRLKVRVEERTATLKEWELRGKAAEVRQRIADQEEASVQFARRTAERGEIEGQLNALWRDARALDEARGYRAESLVTAAVSRVREEHLALARSRQPVTADPREGWLAGNRFFREDAAGTLREAKLDRVEFRSYIGEAGVLAEAFSLAAGVRVSADAMVEVLRALERLDVVAETDVLACFAERAKEAGEREVRRGAEAVFRALTEIDPSLLRGRPILDVSLRESLRVAADWVAWSEVRAGEEAKTRQPDVGATSKLQQDAATPVAQR